MLHNQGKIFAIKIENSDGLDPKFLTEYVFAILVKVMSSFSTVFVKKLSQDIFLKNRSEDFSSFVKILINRSYFILSAQTIFDRGENKIYFFSIYLIFYYDCILIYKFHMSVKYF